MNVLGLFSGIGGFELGLQRAGLEVSKMCEIEDHCVRILNRNFPDIEVDRDIKTLKLDVGEFDVMCGGFPCQDISIAGKNKGLLGGEKSSLWREYLRVIKEGRPKYAIIENVNAILGRGLEIVLQDLAEIGYDATYTTFDSKYFGVPQRRRRVFIIGVRDGIAPESDLFEFGERDTALVREKIKSVEEGFEWDFTKERGVKHSFAYFTRQRSDQFACVGVSSALLKRDYKDFTDVILSGGVIRRVGITERLLLQNYPSDWFDGVELTKKQAYSCNGMTCNVVEHIGKLLVAYDASIVKTSVVDIPPMTTYQRFLQKRKDKESCLYDGAID